MSFILYRILIKLRGVWSLFNKLGRGREFRPTFRSCLAVLKVKWGKFRRLNGIKIYFRDNSVSFSPALAHYN